MLTKEQIEQYHELGYTILRQAVDRATLQKLRDTADRLIETTRTLTQSNATYELEDSHSAAALRLRRIAHPVAVDPFFWEVATSPRILDAVESLVGPNIKFHHSKLNMKASMGGVGIGWHQDFAFFPHTNYDVLGCGLAMDDSKKANGCLLVVPGTHKMPILSHRDDSGEFVGQISGPDCRKFEPEKAAAVELEAGDMSIHNACVVHGSAPNTSPAQRRLLIFEYAACDAIQLDKKPLANEFAERIVRGKPATHARLAGAVSLPLRGIDQGKSIFERQKAKAGAMMA